MSRIKRCSSRVRIDMRTKRCGIRSRQRIRTHKHPEFHDNVAIATSQRSSSGFGPRCSPSELPATSAPFPLERSMRAVISSSDTLRARMSILTCRRRRAISLRLSSIGREPLTVFRQSCATRAVGAGVVGSQICALRTCVFVSTLAPASNLRLPYELVRGYERDERDELHAHLSAGGLVSRCLRSAVSKATHTRCKSRVDHTVAG